MVMPRSFSRSLESMTRSATASLARKVPDWRSMASTRVVLPWSTWAMMAILRIGCDAVAAVLKRASLVKEISDVRFLEGAGAATHGHSSAKRTQLIKFTADSVNFGFADASVAATMGAHEAMEMDVRGCGGGPGVLLCERD